MTVIKFFVTFLLVFGLTAANASKGNIAVAQFTTQITNKEPVNNVTELSAEFNKIYFYTDIRNCSGCRIEHQWWFRGEKVSTVDGRAKSDRYRWWSNKTLTDNMFGDWTVKVVIDGDVVRSKVFTYRKDAVVPQRKSSPVQKLLKVEEDNECEIQLRYFSDKLKESPNDVYFKFMMKKWGNRCSVE